jgi:hypothetical protein
MTIRPINKSIPSTLPAAKLFLDDIEEICTILKGSSVEGNLSTTFVVDDAKVCESLEDLKRIGGHTRDFDIKIEGRGTNYTSYTIEVRDYRSSLYLHSPEGRSTDWSKYGQLSEIFKKRKKRPVLRILAIIALYCVIFLPPLFYLRNFRLFYWTYLSLMYVVSFVMGKFVLRNAFGGTVCLRYSYEVGTEKWLEQHKSELIIGIVCAIVGAVLGAFATRIAEKLW